MMYIERIRTPMLEVVMRLCTILVIVLYLASCTPKPQPQVPPGYKENPY